MNEYAEGFYQVGEQQIHYVEAGKRGRQVALLIHGWSSSWYANSPLLDLLSQRFHAVAIDLPGYGQSPPFRDKTTIPKYGDLLADLIEQISDGPVVLVGHSMGGMISIELSLKYSVLVERMVLLSPTISGRLSTSINLFISPITMMERFGVGGRLVTSVERSFVGLTDRLMRPVSFAERTDITTEDYAKLRMDARNPGQGRVRAECYWAMRENDLSEKLPGVETPALIIWGAEDNTVPLRDAGVVADQWPQADLRIVPKAGHWPQFETPDVTRRYISAYLGLPLLNSDLYRHVNADDVDQIDEIANFFTHSDVGLNLSKPERTRLAAQCEIRRFKRGEIIAKTLEKSDELFIIQKGYVEVWKEPEEGDESKLNGRNSQDDVRHVANLRAGQITGEIAMWDNGERSADLIAGSEGATLLVLTRDRIRALVDNDPELGSRFLWNMSMAMSRRIRFIQWQLNRAEEKKREARTTRMPVATSRVAVPTD